MFNFFKPFRVSSTELTDSTMFDEKTFFQKFINDLQGAKEEVIIESPFITSRRAQMFYPVFKRLLDKGVEVYVITRPPHDQENEVLKEQAERTIAHFERLGVQALLSSGNHHRKLAILDKMILWEGSLNILSQSNSREFMRRIEGRQTAQQTYDFLKFGNIL